VGELGRLREARGGWLAYESKQNTAGTGRGRRWWWRAAATTKQMRFGRPWRAPEEVVVRAAEQEESQNAEAAEEAESG